MSTHDATLLLVNGGQADEHVVVQRADDVIWIANELMEQARQPDRIRIPGDMTVDGDLVSFGTAGEGMGRLTYRITGEDFSRDLQIARREP